MTIERAIEILDPEHREHYDSIEPVNEACRMGMNALKELAELKEKLESGRLVELPCKVGDTVYGVGFTGCMQLYAATEKEKRKISKECFKIDGDCKKCKYGFPAIEKFICTQIQLCDDKYTYIVGKKYETYRPDDVFLTKEAAEARLKELQEKKK